MQELIEQLRNGEFEQGKYILVLKSGKEIWTANAGYGLRFWPESGKGFTFSEKRALMQAIKEGRIKQALTSTSMN